MPRKREGTAFKHGDHFDIQITLPDGTRGPQMCQPPGMSYAAAKEKARHATELANEEGGTVTHRKRGGGPMPSDVPLGEWLKRWHADREKRGHTTVRTDRSRIGKWVVPFLGAEMPMGDITTRKLEKLVEHLDGSMYRGLCSWKSNDNVWVNVTKMFGDAVSSKTVDLRVLKVNPCIGIRGPDRGTKKSKQYLFPAEFARLMACELVPAQWRIMYAIAVYLYLRSAEERALSFDDIDLDHRIVLVHQTEDRNGELDTTKADASRRYSFEAAIVPLLRALHKRAGGKGLLIKMPSENHLATMLRRHLRLAGITRAELFVTDRTRRRLRFHDLKATAITWMAVRGDDPLKIKLRAAHRSFATTEAYIRDAEGVRDGFGEVFPPIPEELVSLVETLDESPRGRYLQVKIGQFRPRIPGLRPKPRARFAVA